MNDERMAEANDWYEARKGEGSPVSIPDVEKEFGIEPGRLGNWRSNRKRLKEVREVQEWPLDDISMHGNIRTEFAVEELQSLANSLRSTTLLQYPLGYVGEKDGKPHLFLTVGERRFRAHELRRDRGEEVDSMMVRVIEKPTAKEFLRMNFVENYQRVDLRPTELADGIRQMLELVDEETGMSPFNVKSAAEELGIHPQRVIDAMNSLKAPAAARKAMDEGRVAVDVVGVIGSLPKEMREDACQKIIFGVGGEMKAHEARRFIANHYRRDLRKADFNRDDASLTSAPACGECSWYGGNRDDLAGPSALYQCLNPACFLEKQKAAAEVERLRILDEGGDVVLLDEEKAEKIFDSVSGRLSPVSGFVALDMKPDPYFLKDKDRGRGAAPKWRAAMGDDLPTVYVAWDSTGKKVEMVEKGPAMVAALNGSYGSLFRAKAAEGLLTEDQEARQRKVETAIKGAKAEVCLEGGRTLYKGLSGLSRFSVGMLRCLLEVAVEQGLKPDDYAFLCEMLEPEFPRGQMTMRGFLELVDVKCGDEAEMLALLTMILQVRVLRYKGFDLWCEDGPMADLCEEVDFAPAEWRKKWKMRARAAERAAMKECEEEVAALVEKVGGAG